VIVFKIDVPHVFSIHTEGKPIIAGRPDAPLAAPAALQWMQLPSWKFCDLLDAPRLLDRVEDDGDLARKIGANSTSFTCLVKGASVPCAYNSQAS
jgi:hypothetical protein